MKPIVNPWAPPSAAPRQPAAAGAQAVRSGAGDAGDPARAAATAPPGATGERAAASTERARPSTTALAPLRDRAAAAAFVTQLCEQLQRHPDLALRAHTPPGAEAVLQLLGR
ncbi:MAG: hypothetical protein KJZ98_11525 [Burkholderiaceae bacterium]|nr:hypothetical protein [Burkholderiaceae bacterium]MEB2352465.1 hypothetical protein [Burkholderiaceae bacterium]